MWVKAKKKKKKELSNNSLGTWFSGVLLQGELDMVS